MSYPNFGESMASGIKKDFTAFKLAAEVVKLKQEVAELRNVVQGLEEVVHTLANNHDVHYYRPPLKPLDDGWGHAEDGWPWDISATDGIAAGTQEHRARRKSFIPE